MGPRRLTQRFGAGSEREPGSVERVFELNAEQRAAVERRIPCFTSLDTAKVAVDVVTRQGLELKAHPLAEYVAGRH